MFTITGMKEPPELRESWIDRVIREAAERGEFDDLPGKGKPLEVLAEQYDENWWVKRWLQREGIDPKELGKILSRRRSS